MKINTIIALMAVLVAILAVSGCTSQTAPPQKTQQTVPSDFSIEYTSEGGFAQTKEMITISANGNFKYEYLSLKDNKVVESYTGNLTAPEMEQLYNFTVNENKFFSLPEELGTGQCADGTSDYIKVQANGKTHKSGHDSINCVVDNSNFNNVLGKIHSYMKST